MANVGNTEEYRLSIEEISKHIEVLLHASESPLTASMLRKQLLD